MEAPTAKRKKGNTKSVGVHPSHFACLRGQYILDQVPGLFTRIIPATVNPLKRSIDRIRIRFSDFNL
ncbi:hypothetical protein LEP1GSC178_1329 [Leptospira licerasiae str. MMD4847]|uniref:Uncharacterized protein n=1 Tax=Leptospira licerasiae str. MMD4847 TaxID=1049971 RepID=A0ABP2RB28_9LEPT|nr:hypothetical protein LEP1GSC178_1329 [Leptospira licerasiae str. MMD4847]